MTNERARARALCMNEYDRNIVSLLSKLFKGERKCHFSQRVFFSGLGKRDMWEVGIFFSRSRVVDGKKGAARVWESEAGPLGTRK